jgi:DNA-binding transcriptional regulator YdaS (Cro superfamily)
MTGSEEGSRIVRPLNPKLKPHKLFDYFIKTGTAKNDADIATILGVYPPYISRIRAGLFPLGPKVILRVYDATDMSIEEIRELL